METLTRTLIGLESDFEAKLGAPRESADVHRRSRIPKTTTADRAVPPGRCTQRRTASRM